MEEVTLQLNIKRFPDKIIKTWKLIEKGKLSEVFKDEIWDEFEIDIDLMTKESPTQEKVVIVL